MITAAGLELTNYLNPDLTWKTVTKGRNRSAIRRTRKTGGRNVTVGVEPAANGHKKAEDTAVSESEKHGVAVLGRRFGDEIEHIPIKKRKFNFWSSPSQPLTPSHTEVVQHASGQGAYPNSNGKRLLMEASSEPIISHGVVDGKISDSVKEKLGYREDFSGIEILAAAACGNSSDADVYHSEEKPAVDGPVKENVSAMFVEEVALMETANYPSRDAHRTEDTSVQDTTHTFVQNSSSKKDNMTLDKSLPSRLHWDLNVVMDAWEEPSDSLGSQTKDVESTIGTGREEQDILEGCETERETKNVKHENIVDLVVSSEVHEKTHIFSDLRGLANGSDKEDNQLETCSGLDRDLDECGADSKDSSLPSYLEEKTQWCASTAKEEDIVAAEIVQVEKYDVASPHIPVLDSSSCEALRENGEDSGRASCLQNDLNAHQEMFSVDNCELPDPVEVEPASKSEEVGVDHPSRKCDDVVTSGEPAKEAHPVVTEEAKGEPDSSLHIGSEKMLHTSSGIVTATLETEEVGVDHPSRKCEDVATSGEPAKEAHPVVTEEAKGEPDSSLHFGSEKMLHTSSGIVTATLETGYTNEECGGNAPSNSSCKINFEESCDDICVSDTSHDDKVHTVCVENYRELQDGYDSQFEDGELRETDAYCWEENNCEGADIEQVDYESECEGERLCIYEYEDIDTKRKFESGSSLGSGEVTEKSEQGAVGDAFGDSLTSSEAKISAAAHANKTKKDTADCEDESSGKNFTCRMVGARASRRDLPPHPQGSLSSDVCRSDYFDDLCPRSEREADPNCRFVEKDRFSLHMRHRSPGGSRIVNTCQSPPYHGPCGYGRLRPRSVVESSGFVMAADCTILETTGVEGLDSRVRRHYMSSSSNSVYRPFNRRPQGYGDAIHTGTAPVRDDRSPDRSRFRRYPQGISRGFREDYRRPMHSYPTNDHVPQRMGRRERSISPLGERPQYVQPYKKPRSRSRSRSPNAWFSMRERNGGSRRRSRSPDFRSTRINRVRAPFKKHFEVEYEEGFVSPPRNLISPQRNTPRFDDRISGLDNFRDRKSPVRMFRQGQRFDSSRPFRPMMPPRRFPDLGGVGAGRGYKYEGCDSDDRRKLGKRYEVIHRARHYDNDGDGVMRRLRYNDNPEVSFVAKEL